MSLATSHSLQNERIFVTGVFPMDKIFSLLGWLTAIFRALGMQFAMD
jgi:hypothetical protein